MVRFTGQAAVLSCCCGQIKRVREQDSGRNNSIRVWVVFLSLTNESLLVDQEFPSTVSLVGTILAGGNG
jgi:hypothetical protein